MSSLEGRDVMNNCRLGILLLMGLFVLSCSSAGIKIDMQAIKDNIRIGESTQADVLRVCGEPLSKNNDVRNEAEIWHYAYVDKNITGTGVFTHVIGVGEEWKSNTTVVDIFFKEGIVVDIKSESSSIKKFNYSLD
jgi:hypothetical protein